MYDELKITKGIPWTSDAGGVGDGKLVKITNVEHIEYEIGDVRLVILNPDRKNLKMESSVILMDLITYKQISLNSVQLDDLKLIFKEI